MSVDEIQLPEAFGGLIKITVNRKMQKQYIFTSL